MRVAIVDGRLLRRGQPNRRAPHAPKDRMLFPGTRCGSVAGLGLLAAGVPKWLLVDQTPPFVADVSIARLPSEWWHLDQYDPEKDGALWRVHDPEKDGVLWRVHRAFKANALNTAAALLEQALAAIGRPIRFEHLPDSVPTITDEDRVERDLSAGSVGVL